MLYGLMIGTSARGTTTGTAGDLDTVTEAPGGFTVAVDGAGSVARTVDCCVAMRRLPSALGEGGGDQQLALGTESGGADRDLVDEVRLAGTGNGLPQADVGVVPGGQVDGDL